jgi:hypothetical protein
MDIGNKSAYTVLCDCILDMACSASVIKLFDLNYLHSDAHPRPRATTGYQKYVVISSTVPAMLKIVSCNYSGLLAPEQHARILNIMKNCCDHKIYKSLSASWLT